MSATDAQGAEHEPRSSWATSPAVRRTMQGNRSRDTLPELKLRSALHRAGLRYFVNHRPIKNLRCRADVVFPRRRLAIFIDGCFWHSCPQHGNAPSVNTEYWGPKLQGVIERDLRNTRTLTNAGWTVLRVWEHDAVDVSVARVMEALGRSLYDSSSTMSSSVSSTC